MALEGTYKVPGIGPVSKQGAVYGTLAIVVIGGSIWLIRKRQHPAPAAAAAAAGGTFTDPAGNTCTAPNPATGFCPGTAEDLAAQQTAGAFNTSQLGAGGLAGYYYGPGGAVPQAPPGPGNFADNAEWSQYVISYLVSTVNANAAALGGALGAYLQGQGVDEAQFKLIEEAIAIGGRPPQAGTGGYPPRIRLEAGGKKPGPARVTVPDVAGQQYAPAARAIEKAGLRVKAVPRPAGIVAYEIPRPGTEADRGSAVALHMAATR